jgi:hypothetical protein
VHNGDETDTDCGGSCETTCPDGRNALATPRAPAETVRRHVDQFSMPPL